MGNLQLGPVIGKLGGGSEINAIPVNFVPSSGTGMKHVVDVPVPAGATARVVVVGSAGGMASNTNAWPILFIGGQNIGIYHTSVGGSATVTGPVAVEVDRRGTTANYYPSFVGTVFWWEVPNG